MCGLATPGPPDLAMAMLATLRKIRYTLFNYDFICVRERCSERGGERFAPKK